MNKHEYRKAYGKRLADRRAVSREAILCGFAATRAVDAAIIPQRAHVDVFIPGYGFERMSRELFEHELKVLV